MATTTYDETLVSPSGHAICPICDARNPVPAGPLPEYGHGKRLDCETCGLPFLYSATPPDAINALPGVLTQRQAFWIDQSSGAGLMSNQFSDCEHQDTGKGAWSLDVWHCRDCKARLDLGVPNTLVVCTWPDGSFTVETAGEPAPSGWLPTSGNVVAHLLGDRWVVEEGRPDADKGIGHPAQNATEQFTQKGGEPNPYVRQYQLTDSEASELGQAIVHDGHDPTRPNVSELWTRLAGKYRFAATTVHDVVGDFTGMEPNGAVTFWAESEEVVPENGSFYSWWRSYPHREQYIRGERDMLVGDMLNAFEAGSRHAAITLAKMDVDRPLSGKHTDRIVIDDPWGVSLPASRADAIAMFKAQTDQIAAQFYRERTAARPAGLRAWVQRNWQPVCALAGGLGGIAVGAALVVLSWFITR